MTSQPGQQTIPIHILPNTSRSNGKQVMKFGQVIEDNKRNIFLQKPCRKWVRETSSRPLFFSKKDLNEVKGSLCSLVSIYFDSPQLGIQ